MSNETLTPKQVAAIQSLMSKRTVTDAAVDAGVTRSTLHRWMADPAFRSALADAERAAMADATRQLVVVQNDSIEALHTLITDTGVKAAVRVSASLGVLAALARTADHRALQARIELLENYINELHNQRSIPGTNERAPRQSEARNNGAL